MFSLHIFWKHFVLALHIVIISRLEFVFREAFAPPLVNIGKVEFIFL